MTLSRSAKNAKSRRWAAALLFIVAASSIALQSIARVDALTRPNILLILTDDQTVQELNRKAMPYLSSKPNGSWINFTKAFVNTPTCCPSRATILSGQYAHHTGVHNNHVGETFNDTATIATWLDRAGYQTALIGKYLNNYPFRRGDTYIPPGWDYWAAFKSPADYYGYSLNENGTLVSYGSAEADYSTDVLKEKAVGFLSTATEPFLLYFAPYAAHHPNTPAPRYQTAFSSLQMPRTPSFNEEDVSDKPEWVRSKPPMRDWQQRAADEERRNQYRTLRSVDDAIAALFDVMQRRGVLDNTVVVFMSDNGHTLGEHRTAVKPCEYEECQKVPLWIRYPGAASRSEARLVSNVDIASTLVQLAGTTASIPQDGRSLVPILDGSATSWRTGVLLEWLGDVPGNESQAPPYWGIRTKRYKYVELSTGEKELYDLSADPFELTNVAGDPAYASVQSRLAQELAQLKQ